MNPRCNPSGFNLVWIGGLLVKERDILRGFPASNEQCTYSVPNEHICEEVLCQQMA